MIKARILLLFLIALSISQELRRQSNVNYPVRFTYINRLSAWYGAQKIAAAINVPEYAAPNIYNYVAISFWTCGSGPTDAVLVWSDPIHHSGANNPFGSSNDEIQKTIREKYHKHGVSILVSAFGATEFPTTKGYDPVQCATKLGDFVLQNNLDGADIDWQDNTAMNKGLGEAWIIAFTKKLRQMLPTHIITHAPQAPYFCGQHYKYGAYMTVHQQVGHLIDFYNIQFYNQGDNTYDTYDKLFVKSVGSFANTSVKELNARGIPLEMIVVGKPVTSFDASNTGWMNKTNLASAISKAVQETSWRAGVMFWQFHSDPTGDVVGTVAKALMPGEQDLK